MHIGKIALAAAGLVGTGFLGACVPEPAPVVYAAPPPRTVVVAPRRTVVVRPGPRCHWVSIRHHHHWRRVRRCR